MDELQIKKNIEKTGNVFCKKKYINNTGGRNAFSGFRGRHSYLKTEIKEIETEVKQNNKLEDEKLQRAEALTDLDLLPIDITDK
jgi:hypothetical protein